MEQNKQGPDRSGNDKKVSFTPDQKKKEGDNSGMQDPSKESGKKEEKPDEGRAGETAKNTGGGNTPPTTQK